MPELSWDGLTTWYEVVGEPGGRLPVVVCHGGPGATHDYLRSLAALAHDGRQVALYDQVGNGRSQRLPDAPAAFWTVELFRAELNELVRHLGWDGGYHVLGQSWGGFLAKEHAFTQPDGLRSLVLSNTAASFPDFVAEANRLRAGLPPDVEATLRRHEAEGTTGDPEYARACEVFYARHLCRLDPWPEEVVRSFAILDAEPTVYHVMNGPSEFHVVGSIRDWRSTDRLHLIRRPALIISGRHDEATPALQQPLAGGIAETEQVLLEHSSHMPFWEEREAYMAAVGAWLARHD
jgi:L-proline amide hydrolase